MYHSPGAVEEFITVGYMLIARAIIYIFKGACILFKGLSLTYTSTAVPAKIT